MGQTYAECVKLLIAAGADVNVKHSITGHSMLMKAASHSLPICKLLAGVVQHRWQALSGVVFVAVSQVCSSGL